NVATPFATFRSCTASLIPDASPSVVATGSAAPAGPENASHNPASTAAIIFPRISPPLGIVAPSVGREFWDANEFGSRGKLSRGASVVDLKFPSSGWRARLGTSMPRGGEFGLGERRLHRLLVAAVEPYVERPAVDVLAIVGDAKGRFCQHCVGLARAVSRQDRRPCRAGRVHDAREKIEDADIDRDCLARMMVAQKY